ncbi:MAG TPA: hypothetical protein VFF06_06795 [Polyangia bacterium]|nr:hypothetical protein [Polyangia bacterium]
MRRALACALLAAGCGGGAMNPAPGDFSTATDLAGVDFSADDLAARDLATPDHATRDLAVPDLAAPDLAVPDLAMPDLATLDLATADGAISADATPPPDLTAVPILTGLAVQQQPNHRALAVSWSVGAYSGAATCQVSLGGAAAGAAVACSDGAATVDLPWLDGQTAWNVALAVAVTPSSGAPASINFTPACAAIAGSASPTPDVDEDCDGYWDNSVTTQSYQTPPLEITYCNGSGGFKSFDLGTQTSAAACVAACTAKVNEPADLTVFYYRNCYWDGLDSTCWVGGTSICTSASEPSYKWTLVTTTTWY